MTRQDLPALLLIGIAASCGSGAGRASPTPAVEVAPASSADVSFMTAMIGHHAQALAMARLADARTTAADIRTLAERIERSQQDEMAIMIAWLRARRRPVPDTTHPGAGHEVSGQHAPGMLSARQLDELRAARGLDFDRLFLARMIQHHRGALEMVRELLSQPGGGHDAEAFRFASDVDADQRAEIARMERMLAARGSPPAGR